MNEPYYRSTVLRVGSEVVDMARQGVVILFAEPVPEALETVSVIHKPGPPPGRLMAAGDVLCVGRMALTVREVGAMADENLRSLGHLVVYGETTDTPLLPGAIRAEGGLSAPGPGDAVAIARPGGVGPADPGPEERGGAA
ncbi:MAG: PTS glucitol/sorbitol transporter subunit IIA [Candidatus Dormibacteraceae bacterium]